MRPRRAQDELMERLAEARGEVRGRAGEHRANRKFSADVREALRGGRTDDARALCARQVFRSCSTCPLPTHPHTGTQNCQQYPCSFQMQSPSQLMLSSVLLACHPWVLLPRMEYIVEEASPLFLQVPSCCYDAKSRPHLSGARVSLSCLGAAIRITLTFCAPL